jgi:hypothetical protein
MNLPAKCVSYVAIVAGLSLGLTYGALWLVSPDPDGQRVPDRPPLPPRIADSIERKKEPPPSPPVVAAKPFVAEPPMQEANVALPPPRQAVRELRVRPPSPKRPPKPDARMQTQPLPIVPAHGEVTTARTDVPY